MAGKSKHKYKISFAAMNDKEKALFLAGFLKAIDVFPTVSDAAKVLFINGMFQEYDYKIKTRYVRDEAKRRLISPDTETQKGKIAAHIADLSAQYYGRIPRNVSATQADINTQKAELLILELQALASAPLSNPSVARQKLAMELFELQGTSIDPTDPEMEIKNQVLDARQITVEIQLKAIDITYGMGRLLEETEDKAYKALKSMFPLFVQIGLTFLDTHEQCAGEKASGANPECLEALPDWRDYYSGLSIKATATILESIEAWKQKQKTDLSKSVWQPIDKSRRIPISPGKTKNREDVSPILASNRQPSPGSKGSSPGSPIWRKRLGG